MTLLNRAGCSLVRCTRGLASKSGPETGQVPVERPKDSESKLTEFKGKRFPDFESTYRKRGTGGRGSFTGISVALFNGTSTVARNLIGRLGRSGNQLIVAYRGSIYDVEKSRVSGDLGQMFYQHFHLKDEDSLYRAMEHSSVVINLIGKENPTSNFSLHDAHVEGPRRMAQIARELGVKKFIHFSSLNASPNPEPKLLKYGSEFYRTKYNGELAVRDEFPNAIIFRPSDILSDRDKLIHHFTELNRSLWSQALPLWDYYYEVQKQPVWIGDVLDGVEQAICNDSADGKTFQAVGPYRYDYCKLIEFIRMCQHNDELYHVTNLRWNLVMRAAINVVSYIQKYPFLTWERIERDLTTDYVDPKLPTLLDLGVKLTPVENHIQRIASQRPKMHRVEIPYESAIRIELPKRLNDQVNL